MINSFLLILIYLFIDMQANPGYLIAAGGRLLVFFLSLNPHIAVDAVVA